MKDIQTEKPHGYLKDSDGEIVLRFGNWSVNQKHTVPEYVDTTKTEYVNGPSAHDKPVHDDYKSAP
jgi:hypothetical protein